MTPKFLKLLARSIGKFFFVFAAITFLASLPVVADDPLNKHGVLAPKRLRVVLRQTQLSPPRKVMKEDPVSKWSNDPSDCAMTAITLFNGLLCSAGESAGCDAVANAQGPNGRWWRSPRRIAWEYPAHDVSFSPDQSLGVLLYVVARHDTVRFSKWLAWIESNRPCTAKIGNSCIVYGWLRFCRDDPDKRCTLRPATACGSKIRLSC